MQGTILVTDPERGCGGVSRAERDHVLDAEPVGISQVRRHGTPLSGRFTRPDPQVVPIQRLGSNKTWRPACR